MKFSTPATSNPIDQLKIVGKPTDRVDGPLKTSGLATYAHEHQMPGANVAYGYVVGAAIAKGRIRFIDDSGARAAPGVLEVITWENAGQLAKAKRNTAPLLGGPDVQHYHQAVAMVVAESFEQARAAAMQMRIDYQRGDGKFDLDAAVPTSTVAKDQPDVHVGDFDKAFGAAAVTLDESYSTPDQSHAMMEPHASFAAWEGDQLTLWTSNQMIDWGRTDVAKTLGMPKDKVRLVSAFVGGGFGGKLWVRADAILAALAARKLKRPVKIALQRTLLMNNTVHRPATVQRVRLGATADGKLTAIGHECWSGDLPGGNIENAIAQTRLLYAAPNRLLRARLATLDLPEGNAMRAPGEASGLMVLEIAMDEMAEKLGIDPIEFRILNDTEVDPEKPERKFSQRRLTECFRRGADDFGWSKRAAPAQTRDGRWLIGMGVAAAFRNNLTMKSAARVRLSANGMITVETDMTDIGTGSYTILAQTAAEMLGVPLERVIVRLGDSDFPVSAGSGGQWGGNSSASGVYAACVKLRAAIAKKLGMDAEAATFADGNIREDERSVAIANAARDAEIVVEDTMEFGDLGEKFQQSTFGAHFVEVAVDSLTAEVRLRRMLAVCAAGRILNPKTARSQVIGAMTMGAGAALMEELAVDKRLGLFVNHDLAGYEVPVHADIPHQDVIFLDETDPLSSPLKAKGVGELGICGVGAAIANAIHNATGIRVRDYPITLDKLIERLPA